LPWLSRTNSRPSAWSLSAEISANTTFIPNLYRVSVEFPKAFQKRKEKFETEKKDKGYMVAPLPLSAPSLLTRKIGNVDKIANKPWPDELPRGGPTYSAASAGNHGYTTGLNGSMNVMVGACHHHHRRRIGALFRRGQFMHVLLQLQLLLAQISCHTRTTTTTCRTTCTCTRTTPVTVPRTVGNAGTVETQRRWATVAHGCCRCWWCLVVLS
jgi:hypothetical protein